MTLRCRHHARTATIIAATAVALLGCGTGDPLTAANTTPVAIGDNYFQPETLTVTVGQVVRWTNAGGRQHRVVSDDGLWQSNPLPHAFWFEVRFDSAGVFGYHCLQDSSHTETGAIIVQ